MSNGNVRPINTMVYEFMKFIVFIMLIFIIIFFYRVLIRIDKNYESIIQIKEELKDIREVMPSNQIGR